MKGILLGVAASLVAGCGASGDGLPDARLGAPLQTTLVSAPAAVTSAAAATFEFEANVADATFACRLDDGAPAPCTSPTTVEVDEGAHVFVVTAFEAGVAELTPPIHGWRVDRTAPTVTFGQTPPSLDNDTLPRFVFEASEPGVAFECSLDGGPFMPCTSPLSPEVGDGEHVLVVRAIDAAGNVGPEATFAWTVDSAVPDTVLDVAPAGVIGPTATDVLFSSPNAGVGASFACSLDGAPFAGCTSPATIAALASGPHVFQARVTSAAGTTDPSPATAVFVVDADPPTASWTAAPSAVTDDHAPSFDLTAADPATPLAFACSLDGATASACTFPLTLGTVVAGAHTLVVEIADAFGNVATLSHAWTIEPRCGDGLPEGAEACDDGDAIDGDGCDRNCTATGCGNGIVTAGEECDDGNLADSDGCGPTCAIEHQATVAITSGPTGYFTTNASPSFAFSITGVAVTTECRVDAATFAPCASPYQPGPLADGDRRIEVRVVDVLGVPFVDARSFTLDTTPEPTWIQASPATSPVGRTNHGMAYDPVRAQVVLLHGTINSMSVHADELWTWDGSTWTLHAPPVRPTPRWYPALAFDPITERVLLFGGQDSTNIDRADTWAWDGTAWTELTPSASPSARAFVNVATDTVRGRLVLFGGESAGTALADTWEWDGASWDEITTPTAPGARYLASMSTDVNGVVLFGGSSGPVFYDDTWTYDGAWHARTPVFSPPSRIIGPIAFDPSRGRAILFGGVIGGTYLVDTWEWTGAQWRVRSPTTSPPARTGAEAAYDEARGAYVLFGGFNSGVGRMNDTWLVPALP
ncbi:MAG: hypothetical protein R2939_17685 [Kofleriaceae bacterium]